MCRASISQTLRLSPSQHPCIFACTTSKWRGLSRKGMGGGTQGLAEEGIRFIRGRVLLDLE